MTRKLLFFSFFLLTVSLTTFLACQKDSGSASADNTPFGENSVEKNAVVATTTFDELNDYVQSGFDFNTLKSLDLTIGTCPVITVNFTTPPFSVTLDWGTGCKGTDGVTRTGKIVASLSGLMSEKNSVATLKIENYIVDGKKISGTTKITYVGLNTGNNWPRYSVLSEGKIVFADNTTLTYRSEYVRLQATGSGTPSMLDDTWRMEGTSSGVNRDGVKWTAKTTKVLIKKGDCKYIDSGTLVVTPETGAIRTIDFGDGTCDNKATLTIGDKVTNITL